MDILDSIDDLDAEIDFSSDSAEDYRKELEDILVESSELNEAQAKKITEAIKSTATATYILLAEAHKKKAFKALGYNTWAEYVRSEFDFTPQRSYQLLDLSKTIKAIEEASPDGTEIRLTEAQARDIKGQLDSITEKIREETKDLTPEDAESVVDRILADSREQMKADQKAIEEREKKHQEELEEQHRAELEAQADAILESDAQSNSAPVGEPQYPDVPYVDDSYSEVQVEGANNISPREASYLRGLIESTENMKRLPDPDDFVKIIPEGGVVGIYKDLMDVSEWLNRLIVLMEDEFDL